MSALRVAAIQAAPEYLNLSASLAKVRALAADAAGRGARIVCFGETWLPGYPAWLDFCAGAALWGNPEVKEVFARLRENSITVDGDAAAALAHLAAELKITLVIGVNERVDAGPGNGTLYNSLLTFTPDGKLANHHRKLVPTYTEKMVWGPGDARGLRAVPSPGARVGGLICWEHWMPLTRQALHDSGEEVHIAVWPTVSEMHQLASRHYAFEGRCYVVAVGLIMRAAELPLPYDAQKHPAASFVERGGSAIIGPDGQYVAGPVFDREEILIADVDLRRISEERMTLDVSGHYARPDVFDFSLRCPPSK